MSEYTPGPYAYWLDPDQNTFRVFQDLECRGYGRMLATIEGEKGHYEANARLFAAAPDLLDALENLMLEAIHYRDSGVGATFLTASIGVARTAIAKARGKQPT